MSTGQCLPRGLLVWLVAAAVIASGILPPAIARAKDQNFLDCTRVQGNFGRMFSRLPAARWAAADVDLLAGKVMAMQEAEETPEGQADPEENNDIDAGFTYVGQFIDHDLTLDRRPDDLTTPTDPFSLPNLRTPAFDLDSVYGAGPGGSPYLYQADGVHLKLGMPLTGASTDPGAVDLPRDTTGQALLGDPRDDENRIVASLHTIVMRFHNLWVDRLIRGHRNWSRTRIFAEAQRQVLLHYQWAVMTDFLPAVVGQETLAAVFPMRGAHRETRLTFYNPCTMNMPVEFSVAAYRFGHSMVRPIYRVNTAVADRLPVFSVTNDPTKDLGGFRPSPPNFAIDYPEESEAITDVSPAFAGKAPLWTYILAEATANAFRVRDGHIAGAQIAPMRLGRVGGRIVAEIFMGLMLVDRSSIFYNPSFRPDSAFTDEGRFGFRELIRAVIAD